METKTTTAITDVKREVRLHEWKMQIEAQQASGTTVQQWCADNGINPKTYYYRMRKVREQCVDTAPSIVPITLPQQSLDIHTICNIGNHTKGVAIAVTRMMKNQK